MKVIWTLASGKAFDRPTSFGRLLGRCQHPDRGQECVIVGGVQC